MPLFPKLDVSATLGTNMSAMTSMDVEAIIPGCIHLCRAKIDCPFFDLGSCPSHPRSQGKSYAFNSDCISKSLERLGN